MSIAENIRNINAKLPSAVRLVAVSKFHPVENILEAYDAGQRIFAESRPQELLAKVTAVKNLQSCGGVGGDEAVDNSVDKCGENRRFEDIEWHFIGHLQTNKLKMVLPYVTLVQSVDSERLLSAIGAWGRENGRITNVLLECHIASEESKQGFTAEEIMDLLSRAADFKNVRFCGLMGMATFTDNKDVIRSDFARIRSIFDELRCGMMAGRPEFRELSIGMSDDYLIALEYGATMVRIGTDIFGSRVY
ncbi:MAG: YggS family pyridoxal phosphate-dependent enzyme [Bacteroidales bacterium]|nr:YggS family pyridoxal phosphate-dependent enzyme [Bacteroidales bacterium]